MVKKTKARRPRITVDRAAMEDIAKTVAEIGRAMFSYAETLRDTNSLLRRLAQPTRAYSHAAMKRFHAWAAAELDRKNTGKPEIADMPDALRAMPAPELTRWLSDDVRAFEAIKMSIEESLKLSGIEAAARGLAQRDITQRWPDARLPAQQEDE